MLLSVPQDIWAIARGWGFQPQRAWSKMLAPLYWSTIEHTSTTRKRVRRWLTVTSTHLRLVLAGLSIHRRRQ